MEQPPPELRISDADRHRIAQVLQDAAGDGRLTLDELQERLDRVFAAKTFGEVTELTADLPGHSLAVVDQRDLVRSTGGGRDLVGGAPGGASMSIAVFGGSRRGGAWVVPETYHAFAMYGGVELDLRQARFAEPVTTIYASCLFGGVTITVPDDVVVHVSGFPMFGGYGLNEDEDLGQAPPGAPVLHVKGGAMFGGVNVQRRRRKPLKPLGSAADGPAREPDRDEDDR